MNPRLERYVRRAALTLAIFGLTVVTAGALRRHFLPLPLDRCRTSKFKPSLWRDSAQVYSEAAVRGCIVDDLLEHHNFKGESRQAVVALLGEPKPTQYFSDYDLVYWLGPERSIMSIDSEWLVFRLDSGRRVSESGLVTD